MQNLLSYTMPIVTKASVVDVNKRDRTVNAIIATDRVDSDKEVIQIAGLDMSRFDKNPVVLFMHDPHSVVGKCTEWRRRKKDITAVTQFAETDLAEEVFQLCIDGFLKGWSVGMECGSIERRDITAQDVRKRKDWTGARWIIEKAMVGEYSVVSLPANEDALTQASKKGLIKLTRKWLTPNVANVPNVAPPVRVVAAPAVTRSVKSVTIKRPPLTAAMIQDEVRKAVRYLRGID